VVQGGGDDVRGRARFCMEVLTRESPLARRLLKRVATPYWLEELVMRRCAACKSTDGENGG
jgi:hypothetical protein